MKQVRRSLKETSEPECRRPEAMTVASQHSLTELVPAVTADPARVGSHLVALHQSDPFAARQYQNLAAAMIALDSRSRVKRLVIASASHGDGRTSVTLNLAGTLASTGRRVLVVESDLVRPSMLRFLAVDVSTGLPDGLSHGLTVSEIARKILPFNFDLLATRSPVENSVALLASSAFKSNLQMVAGDYDFILFDSPPLLLSRDAQLLLRLVDKMLFVVRPGVITPAQMAEALAMFTKKDLLGVVLNRAVRSSIKERI